MGKYSIEEEGPREVCGFQRDQGDSFPKERNWDKDLGQLN